VAISLLDTLDGDPDREDDDADSENENRFPDTGWAEWHTRGRHKLAGGEFEAADQNEDDEDDRVGRRRRVLHRLYLGRQRRPEEGATDGEPDRAAHLPEEGERTRRRADRAVVLLPQGGRGPSNVEPARTRGNTMQLVPHSAAVMRTKELARSLDLDLLLRTYTFIPRKILRDTVREFGSQLEGKVLDVGCGSQQYREFLNYQQYFGIEWSVDKRPPVVADVTQIPFRDAAFDSALCTEVLEHLPEPGRCLDEIHRVVKPGGSVFVTAPMTVHPPP